jgi:hypothetical protein
MSAPPRVDETKRHVCTLSLPRNEGRSQHTFCERRFYHPSRGGERERERERWDIYAAQMMLEWRRKTQNSRQRHSLGGRDELGAQVLFHVDSLETDTEELSARDLQHNVMHIKETVQQFLFTHFFKSNEQMTK